MMMMLMLMKKSFAPLLLSLVGRSATAFHTQKLVLTPRPHHNQVVFASGHSSCSVLLHMASADENSPDTTKKGLPFPLPSLNQALYIWLILVSGSRLANTANQWNLALNGLLCAGSFALLLKSLQKIDYETLDDFDNNSLARQAGKWALDEEIPTTYLQANGTVCEVATFAGGCFWGTELHYQRIPGVVATCVGYTQGQIERPTYEQVCSGQSGHTEATQLMYDPTVCSFERLLNKLFDTIDPTALNRVGADRGTQYRHGIYTHTVEQAETAAAALSQLQTRYDKPIVTEVLPAKVFWPAENYHQRYLEKGGQSAAKNCEERVRCYG